MGQEVNIYQQEVDNNYEAFKKQLPNIIDSYAGKYAVMRHGKIVEYMDSFGDAVKYAKSNFSDGVFSIQEVSLKVAELGILSHAVL